MPSGTRWRRRFLAVALAQIALFVLLCVGFYLFVRTAPRHAGRPAPPAPFTDIDKPSFLEEEDRVLFAAATVSLSLVTFILGIFAIFTWIGLKETVEDKVALALEGYHRVERARIDAKMGTIYGQLLRLLDPADEERRHYFLKIAILHLQRSYPLLDGEDATKAKNNLTFYLARRGEEADAEEAIALAEECLKRGSPDREIDLQTTYGFVISSFAEYLPQGEYLLQKALRLTQKLDQDQSLSRTNRDEVQRNLSRLGKALASVQEKKLRGEMPEEGPGKLLARALRGVWRKLVTGR